MRTSGRRKAKLPVSPETEVTTNPPTKPTQDYPRVSVYVEENNEVIVLRGHVRSVRLLDAIQTAVINGYLEIQEVSDYRDKHTYIPWDRVVRVVTRE